MHTDTSWKGFCFKAYLEDLQNIHLKLTKDAHTH